MSLQTLVKVGVVTFAVFDVLWFLRLGMTKLATMLRRKISPLAESVIYSFCSTHDLDFMGHMNNARYFRELDFGRCGFITQTLLGNSRGVRHT